MSGHQFAPYTGPDDPRLALDRDRKAALARSYGAAGAKVIADIFRTGGLLAKNDAVDFPHFNPMAAGSVEGNRRMCLDLIDKTIGIEEAIAFLAERIASHPFPPERAAPQQARPAITENNGSVQ